MADNLNSSNKKISTSAFFGEDKVEKYRQELIGDGKIPGTDSNATPEERRQGFNLYRKNKIDFKTFVEKVLMKKDSVLYGEDDKKIDRGGALIKAPPTDLAIVKKKPEEAKIEQPKNGLDEIIKILNSILKTLQGQFKVDKKQSDSIRKQEEGDKRTKREEGLEGFKKGISAVSGVAKKILAPFQSIIDRIWKFIFFTLLGRAFTQLMDWLGDPANKKKIDLLGRFIKDWWPTLLGAAVLFFTPFGKFVRGTLGIVGSFAGRLVKLIPQIANAIKGLALNPWVAVPAAIAGAAIVANEITGQRKAASVQAQNKARAQTGKGLGVQGTDTMTDKVPTVGNTGPTTPYGLLQPLANGGTVMNGLIPRFTLGGITPSFGNGYGGIDGNTGQTVSGFGVDTQMIVAQPGEVVINKKTVDAVGADTFLGLNRKYGGSGANKPKMSKVYSTGGIVQRFNTGGMVGGGSNTNSTNLNISNNMQFAAGGRTKPSGSNRKENSKRSSPKISISDYNTLLAISSLEDDNPQGRADVAQSIYNRLYAASNYKSNFNQSNNSLKSLIIASDQYQPTFRNSIDWSNIVDRKTAALAIMNSEKGKLYKWDLKEAMNQLNATESSLKNPILQERAQKHVGGRAYFQGKSEQPNMKPGDVLRGPESNFFSPWYMEGTRYDKERRNVPGPIPLSLIEKPGTKTSPKNGFVQNLVQQFSNFVSPIFGRKGTKKQGGGPIGLVKENTGMNIPGATADRQQVNLQPGEFILPKLTVNAIGGEKILNSIVAMTDSNSNAAKLGKRSSGYTPGPLSSRAGRGGMITLPPITQSSGGGMKGGAAGTPEIAFSAVSPSGSEDRAMNASIYGIVG